MKKSTGVSAVKALAPSCEVAGDVAVEAASSALIARERRGGAVDFGTGEPDAVMVKEHSSAVCLVVGSLEVFCHRCCDLHAATEGGELS